MDNDVVILFNPSAFKHNFTEADIRWALDTSLFDGKLDEKKDKDARDKYLNIGFDRNVNALEILYNVIDDNTINIFHANKLSNKYKHFLNNGGNNGSNDR
jgi:hypothetical protein